MKHYKKRKGIIRKRMMVYCPREGVEKPFSFNPTDFCPICKNRVYWSK